MATIYDVAQRAGVSPATVSRVFNGARVSASKQRAVREAAQSLGFVPNENARRLRLGRSQIIAMLIPDIENAFFTAMTRAVTDAARAAGYSVMLGNTDDDPDQEAELMAAAIADPVAGIIVAPADDRADYGPANGRHVPVVAVDRDAPSNSVDTVVADNVSIALTATRQLFAAGHRRVACVSGPPRVMTADQRCAGYAQGWQEAMGTAPPDELLVRATYTVAGGRAGAQALLGRADPPDAIVAANNRIAVGLIRQLWSVGLDTRIPVASVGELPFVVRPPQGLLTVSLPARELGAAAARLLLERIHGFHGSARRVVLPCGTTVSHHTEGEEL